MLQQKIIAREVIIMEVHQPLNRDYYCSTCQQGYQNNDLYKQHYKSDYHRYNIKRKMVNLPPVSLTQFSTKVQQTKTQSQSKFRCNECRKTFASSKTLTQHVVSKGHNATMIVEERIPPQPAAPVPFIKNQLKCLFCDLVSKDLVANEEHMQVLHSFFVPQKQFCINLGGLLEYLQEKIEVGHMCLTCQNKKAKDFQSADAVRKHMKDRGHSTMKTDQGFEEYEKYYDFSRLFEEKLKEQDRKIPGIQYQKVKVFVDQDEKEEQGDQSQGDQNEEWESDSDEQNTGQIIEEKKKNKIKVYEIMKPTLTANEELLLPNGKLLGNRKYRQFYKQTLRMPSWFARQLKQIAGNNSALTNALAERRSILEVMKFELQNKRQTFNSRKHALHLGMTNNNLQYYFRVQNPK